MFEIYRILATPISCSSAHSGAVRYNSENSLIAIHKSHQVYEMQAFHFRSDNFWQCWFRFAKC